MKNKTKTEKLFIIRLTETKILMEKEIYKVGVGLTKQQDSKSLKKPKVRISYFTEQCKVYKNFIFDENKRNATKYTFDEGQKMLDKIKKYDDLQLSDTEYLYELKEFKFNPNNTIIKMTDWDGNNPRYIRSYRNYLTIGWTKVPDRAKKFKNRKAIGFIFDFSCHPRQYNFPDKYGKTSLFFLEEV